MPDFFLKLMGDGVPVSGDSKHPNRKGWFDVISFGMSGQGGRGRVEESAEISISFLPTETALHLIPHYMNGNRFDWLTVEPNSTKPGWAWFHMKSAYLTAYMFRDQEPKSLVFIFVGISPSVGVGSWPGPGT